MSQLANKNYIFKDRRSFLPESKYIISEDLHRSLASGILHSEGVPIQSQNNNQDRIYLLMFRVLNYNSKALIYNYITYPLIFTHTLYDFIVHRSNVLGNTYREPGNLLCILDKQIFGTDHESQDVDKFLHPGVIEKDLDTISKSFYTFAITDILKYINKLVIFSDVFSMSLLIDIAYNKNYDVFVKEILGSLSNYDKLVNKLSSDNKFDDKNKDIDTNAQAINIINSCLFIVRDEKKLINNIKALDYNVNPGPQSHRGKVNSINSSLSILDMDYRKSLYNHNRYHTSGGFNSRLVLPRDKFSFNNIHMNLGDIKWFSTKRNIHTYSDKDSTKPTKPLVDRFRNMYQYDIFNQLAQFFKNFPHNNDTQLKVENFLLDHSKSLFDNTKSVSKDMPIDYSLFSIKFVKLLNQKAENLNSLIDNTRNRKYKSIPKIIKEKNLYYLNNILKAVDNKYIISIIYGRLLLMVNINNKLNNYESTFYLTLGRDLVNHYYYCLYSKYVKSRKLVSKDFTMSDWKDINESIINTYNNSDDKFVGMLGGILIKWMIDLSLIEREFLRLPRLKVVGILVPSKEVNDVLRNENNVIHLPRRMPMIVKPKPYYREKRNDKVIDKLGGYLLNDVKYTESLIKPKWDMMKSSIVKEKNLIYSLANNVNSVPFKINKNVLDFIKDYDDLYGLIDLENYEHLVHKPRLNKTEYIQLESFLSKRALYENILGLATAYSNVSEFYLPIRIEFRGRLNCISDFLNYQSSDLAKSLLLFSRGEKLYKNDNKSIGYFKAYGANCFGNKLDKKSWNDRIKWLNENENDIINFRNGKLISEADDKLLFIAFCFEYNRYHDSLKNIETTYFETFLPIKLDATCNGYQHMALLSADNKLSKELNLSKSTWADTPKDFYGFIGASLVDWAKNKIKFTSKSDPYTESYDRLSRIKIVRSILKGPVMTWAYNITPYELVKKIRSSFVPIETDESASDLHYIEDEIIDIKQNKSNSKSRNKEKYFNLWFKYTKDSSIVLKGKDFSVIRLGLEDVLNSDMFKIKKLTTYLSTMATILTKINLVISWGTPNGVYVTQSYLITKETKLKPFSSSRRAISITIPDPEKRLNKRKQIRSFMPNLIHSLDASSLALLVDLYFGNNSEHVKNIFTIHDCFAVTANNVDTVMDLLKFVYVKIYSDTEYLRELDKTVRRAIIFTFGKESFNKEKLEVYVNGETYKYPSVEDVLDSGPISIEHTDSSYIMH